MRIATWNVNSLRARLPRVLGWLAAAAPDVLCVQELKCAAPDVPVGEFAAVGYQIAVHSTGRWNGVAVLSKIGLADVRVGLGNEPGYQPEGTLLPLVEPRAIAATCGGVRVWSVYVPNGRSVGHPHYRYKLDWLAALTTTIEDELSRHTPLVVLGDFNIAPTAHDVYDADRFTGATHVSPAERAALAELTATGLTDVYPRALKHDRPFTYWDYRRLAFPRNEGMRIDLALADREFATAVIDAYVDREARKGPAPSDHAPVVVDLSLARALQSASRQAEPCA